MMFSRWINWLVVLPMAFFTLACAEDNKDDEGVGAFSTEQTLEYSAESAVNALKGFSDDSGSYQAPQSSAKSKTVCSELAALKACDNGNKRAEYDNCRVPFTIASATGFVNLDYSNNSCDMGSGQSVNRTYDLKFTSIFGQLQITSESRNDYLGQAIGGGGHLTNLGSSRYQIDVDGQHRILRNLVGRELVNFSLRTTQPIVIDGDWTSQSRVVESGQVTISHNRLKAEAVYTYSNISYSNSCCYPISGQVNYSISGSVNRSGTITITGCGTADVSHNGAVKSLTFNSCE